MNGEQHKDDDIAREVAALDAFLRAEFWRAMREPNAYSLLWES